MNFSPLQYYAQMQEEICQLEAYSKNEIARLEGCFSIALSYQDKIKKLSASYVFRYESDEIHFFKNIKPLFMGATEYYTLLYQAVLFKPANDKNQRIAYWQQQLKRVDRFYNRHREFYQYYISGHTHRDRLYFILPGNTGNVPDQPAGKTQIPPSAHQMAARILGYQQYRLYVESELELLMKGFAKKSSHNNPLPPEMDLVYLLPTTDTAVFSLHNNRMPVLGFKQYFVSLISIIFSYR